MYGELPSTPGHMAHAPNNSIALQFRLVLSSFFASFCRIIIDATRFRCEATRRRSSCCSSPAFCGRTGSMVSFAHIPEISCRAKRAEWTHERIDAGLHAHYIRIRVSRLFTFLKKMYSKHILTFNCCNQ